MFKTDRQAYIYKAICERQRDIYAKIGELEREKQELINLALEIEQFKKDFWHVEKKDYGFEELLMNFKAEDMQQGSESKCDT